MELSSTLHGTSTAETRRLHAGGRGGSDETDQTQAVIRPLDRPGDRGWVVTRPREAAWIAELDGVRMGCGFCVTDDDETAKLRIPQ